MVYKELFPYRSSGHASAKQLDATVRQTWGSVSWRQLAMCVYG